MLNDRITEKGMLTRAGNIVLLVPPLTVNEQEVDEMVDIVDEAIGFVESKLGLG
jgi:adenosylmethionine-8-amino-7-oxononanoate aminotransferase